MKMFLAMLAVVNGFFVGYDVANGVFDGGTLLSLFAALISAFVAGMRK